MCVQLQIVRLISTMFVLVLVANYVTYFMLIGCPPGFHIDASHERFCQICPRGYYNDDFDQHRCTRCPPGQTSGILGSRSVDCRMSKKLT